MSKIEVLWVPDERLREMNPKWYNELPEGTLVVNPAGETFDTLILPDEKPALLAALLEDAGAVKVSDMCIRGDQFFYEQIQMGCAHSVGEKWLREHLQEGSEFWLLPVPEGE